MTTLDPSHFPWHARDGDPTKGAAVHTSVRAPAASTSRAKYDTSTSSSEDIDADELGDHENWLRRRKLARKERKRLDQDAARAQGRIPTIPVPDVRFEQSYLMSIQPFIHTSSINPTGSTSTAEQDDKQVDIGLTSSELRKDKRRRVEESLALVEDPASGHSHTPFDDLLYPSKDRRVTVDWSSIAYVTFRDQILSPLIQGALWAVGGIVLNSLWTSWRTRFPPKPKTTSSGTSALQRLLSKLPGALSNASIQ